MQICRTDNGPNDKQIYGQRAGQHGQPGAVGMRPLLQLGVSRFAQKRRATEHNGTAERRPRALPFSVDVTERKWNWWNGQQSPGDDNFTNVGRTTKFNKHSSSSAEAGIRKMIDGSDVCCKALDITYSILYLIQIIINTGNS
jgi:hypothetical protein